MTIQLSCKGWRQKNDEIDMSQQAGMSVVTVILLIQSSSRNKKLKQKTDVIKTEIRKIRVTCPSLAIKHQQWPAVSGGGPY